MNAEEAITELRKMQRQIIHGSSVFGDCADVIEQLRKRTGGAFALIELERRSQIAKGFDAAHDDKHQGGELADAAACYASVASAVVLGAEVDEFPVEMMREGHLSWPFEDEDWKMSADPIRNLVKAGALIVAEIERLQRELGAI